MTDSTKFENNYICFEGMPSLSALINSVKNGNPKRRIVRVLFDEQKLCKERGRYLFIKSSAKEIGFELQTVPSDVITSYTNGHTHGGIITFATGAVYSDISQSNISTNGFAIIIEGVEDPYSLGYSLRTLYACGADSVILPHHLPQGADSVLCRASAGASELLNIYLGDTRRAAEIYKAHGYKIACAAIPDSVPCFESDMSLPLLLIIGGEKRGISSKLLALSDFNVRIPYGRDFLGSLSTASAVSILAYEVLRQKSKT